VALVVEVAGIPLVVQAVPGLLVKEMLGGTTLVVVITKEEVAAEVLALWVLMATQHRITMVVLGVLEPVPQLQERVFSMPVVAGLEQQLGLRHMEFRG
jgi:hypothetical protein